MKYKFGYNTFIVLMILLLASPGQADIAGKTLIGNYRTKRDGDSSLVLHLKPDHKALIEFSIHYDKYEDRDTWEFPATWYLEGENVIITYKEIKQVMAYHEKLSLKSFGVNDHVPGLKSIEEKSEDGLLNSTILWKSEDLVKKLQEKGVKVYFFDEQFPISVLLLPGLFFIFIGIFLMIKRFFSLRSARDVLGTVTEFSARFPGSDSDVLPHYLPKVKFVAENGKSYEFVDNFASKWLSNHIGDQIAVLYHPNDPRKAFINNFLVLWGRPLLVTIFGIFLLYLFL